jgi:two-component system, OmpR family, sensor kinase
VFLSRAGHDLRGELATMVAGVHYLARYEKGVGEAGRQMLDRVTGAGQRLGRLLDELELAAWIGGRPAGALVSGKVALGALVDPALARLERTVQQRKVTVHAEVPGDLPDLEGDAELLGVAVEYLIDFAVARSPGRGVAVRGAFVEGAPVLVVTDEGGPVAAEALARIFEPFAEKELLPRPEPGARRRERLGLGLAIACGIFEAHGGTLTAALAPDGGGVELTSLLTQGNPGCGEGAPV